MPSGTGIDLFEKVFPERTFDVGNRRAARGDLRRWFAHEGYKPFCAFYSTFLQRGYDQVVHDVAIQRFAGALRHGSRWPCGADGPTHAGSFDLAYLGCLPGFVIMAAATSRTWCTWWRRRSPSTTARRRCANPRGEGVGVEMPTEGKPLEIGKGRIIREGSRSHNVARHAPCGFAESRRRYSLLCLSTTVADARFAKPLDTDLVLRLANDTSADHDRGRRDSAASRLRCSRRCRQRRARPRPQDPLDDPARHLIDQDSPNAM